MPRVGYRAITVPDHLADLLSDKAKDNDRSVPKQIEHLVRRQYPHLRPVSCSCGYVTHINPRKRGEKHCRNCGGVVA